MMTKMVHICDSQAADELLWLSNFHGFDEPACFESSEDAGDPFPPWTCELEHVPNMCEFEHVSKLVDSCCNLNVLIRSISCGMLPDITRHFNAILAKASSLLESAPGEDTTSPESGRQTILALKKRVKDYVTFARTTCRTLDATPDVVFSEALNEPLESVVSEDAMGVLRRHQTMQSGSEPLPWKDGVLCSFRLPRTKVASALMSTFYAPSSVDSVSATSNGSLLAVATLSRVLLVNDVGEFTECIDGNKSFVSSLCLSPDGNSVLYDAGQRSMRLYDIPNRKVVRTFRGHAASVNCVAISPDGRLVASGSRDRQMRVFSVTGEQRLTFASPLHDSEITSISFNFDGTRIASGSHEKVRVWDVHRFCGKLLHSVGEHTDAIISVRFAPHVNLFATSSRDRTVRLWGDGSDKSLRVLQGHSGFVCSLAFSPRGDYLVSGSNDRTLRVWHVSSGDCVNCFRGHTSRIYSLCFHPNSVEGTQSTEKGMVVVSGSVDGTVRMWDVLYPQDGNIVDGVCAHTPSLNKPVPTTGGSEVKVPTAGNKGSGIHTGGVQERTGDLMGSVNANVSVSSSTSPQGTLTGVDVDPTGTLAVSTCQDKHMYFWDLRRMECVKRISVGASFSAMSIDPSQPLLVTASLDHTMRLWSLPAGECLRQWYVEKTIRCVRFGTGNEILSCNLSSRFHLWDVSPSGEETTCPLREFEGDESGIRVVRFMPDSSKVVSGACSGVLEIWDKTSAERVKVLQGHTEGISSISCRKDIIVSAAGPTIKVWDLMSHTCVHTLFADTHEQMLSVSLCPLRSSPPALSADAEAVADAPQPSPSPSPALTPHTGHAVVAPDAGVPTDLTGAVDALDPSFEAGDGTHERSGRNVRTLKQEFTQPQSPLFVCASSSGKLRLYNADTGAHVRTLIGHMLSAGCVAWGPRGDFIVSGSQDSSVRMWSVLNPKGFSLIQ
eukprot:Rmarinus@m.3016